MKRTLALAFVAALALSGCSGDDDDSATASMSASASAEPTVTASASASASAAPAISVDASASTIALPDTFCDDADQLYQRDLTMSDAMDAVDPSAMTDDELADPDVFASYLEAIDIDGWQSWRALYLQAAEDSESEQMQEWIAVIVAATDLQYEVYADAAETTDNIADWIDEVNTMLADRSDEIEVEGNEALNASEASLTACSMPLSVPAGELLGYVG
ncbi:hypothetical protein [Demequina salsinemoris]|uniref:hypothetical protein n=1 Tax=Demequina salsinemoris TaxID=577470 RepID=UPI000782C394|nr:hypothetical protein [Demequina salsinemoris]